MPRYLVEWLTESGGDSRIVSEVIEADDEFDAEDKTAHEDYHYLQTISVDEE